MDKEQNQELKEVQLEDENPRGEHVSSKNEQTTILNTTGFQAREIIEDKTVYAGFWIRFWAYIIDLIVIASISGIIINPLFRMFNWSMSEELFTPYNISTAIVFYLYFILSTKKFGQTLGKMICGIRVIPLKEDNLSWMTVLFREWIGRYISATVLFLYLFPAFMPKKQALHDFFIETVVIHENIELKEPVLSIK